MKSGIISLLILSVFGSSSGQLTRLVQLFSKKCATADASVCSGTDVTFWLYTNSTKESPSQLDIRTLDRAPWVNGPLKFIVHGYSVDKDTAVNAVLRPAYFAVGEYNIVSVDWSPLARDGCYIQAVRNVQEVAKCVSSFFNAVVQARRFSSVHLLGHSMGAHVAAWASEDIPGLPRLTSRAAFIDVYHSNCGLKGQRKPWGDLDVYFNNNVFQPGCKCDTGCSHLRAVEFYAETVSTPARAFPCSGWDDYEDGQCAQPRTQDLVEVGERADTRARGSFMAFTNAQSPFFLPDSVYTNASFNEFKATLASECSIAHNSKKLISDWL